MSHYKIPEGTISNPIRDYPRNMVCPCASGKKFKKCCYLTTPNLIRVSNDKVEAISIFRQIKRDFKAKRRATK